MRWRIVAYDFPGRGDDLPFGYVDAKPIGDKLRVRFYADWRGGPRGVGPYKKGNTYKGDDTLRDMVNAVMAYVAEAQATRLAAESAPSNVLTMPTSSAGDGQGEMEIKHAGRPGLELDHKEYIYRLAKAQESEEIKEAERGEKWRSIANRIGWRYGHNDAGIKLLEDARKRLKRADSQTLAEVKEYREKGRKEKT